MLKVIIIDDESLTREGLSNFIDWKSHGFDVVGTADDGLNGVELAVIAQPDLAICDIRMPHMDGLEMAAQINELVPHCRIVFLSGYSDKEYLKSAIKLQAVDYLEKPIDLELLVSLLSKVKKEINDEKNQVNSINQMNLQLEKSNKFVLNSLIGSLVDGRISVLQPLEDALSNAGISFPLNASYRCVVIEYRDNNMQEKLFNALSYLREFYGLTTIFSVKSNECIIFHAYETKSERLLALYNEMFEELGYDFYAGLGKQISLIQDIHESYQDAKDAISWNGFKNPQKLVVSETHKVSGIIREVEQFISKNYNEDLTINRIAEEVFLSPQYLCKIYKSETGSTINSYITELRMQQATKLLKKRSLKLYEVADMLGYRDANYFARVFRKYHGINPSEYREQNNI